MNLPTREDFLSIEGKHRHLVDLHSTFTPKCRYAQPDACGRFLDTVWRDGQFPIGSVWDARHVQNARVMVVGQNPGGIEPHRQGQYRRLAQEYVSERLDSRDVLSALVEVAIAGFAYGAPTDRTFWRRLADITSRVAVIEQAPLERHRMFEWLYYTNVIKCTGDPSRDKDGRCAMNCSDYLACELELVQPSSVICLQLKSGFDLAQHVEKAMDRAWARTPWNHPTSVHDFLHPQSRGAGISNEYRTRMNMKAAAQYAMGTCRIRFHGGVITRGSGLNLCDA